jgi:hypothetical protein
MVYFTKLLIESSLNQQINFNIIGTKNHQQIILYTLKFMYNFLVIKHYRTIKLIKNIIIIDK